MANTCAYCTKELKRLIFCNNSHRSMYYQKKKFTLKAKLCEHGSMKGLCKKGCK